MPHKRLLKNLKGYGIGGNLHKWIENVPTGREQRVVLNNSHSMWAPVISGIPQGQGSVL